MNTFAYASATELASGLAKAEFSAEELVRFYLGRIADYNSTLHAYVAVYERSALLQARAADLKRQSGLGVSPVCGIPFAVKDNFELENHVTTWGAIFRRNEVSRTTSGVLSQMMSADGVLLGKNHLTELTYSGWGLNPAMGTPSNPWSMRASKRICGGSSSGSAAAVAAGLAPIALGSDTGGSVRIPAAFCGLTGYRPTSGRMDAHGILPLAPSLDSAGILARSAKDVALYAALLDTSGSRQHQRPSARPAPDLADSAAAVRGTRILVMREEDYPCKVDLPVKEAVEGVCALLESLGAIVEYAKLPFRFSDIVGVQGALTSSQAYHYHAAYIQDQRLRISDSIRSRIVAGKEVTALQYLEAQTSQKQHCIEFEALMRQADLLLTPTVPFSAPEIKNADDEQINVISFTRPVAYLNACALTIPSGFDAGLYPVGVQFIARRMHDATLFKVAQAIQEVTDWHLSHPEDESWWKLPSDPT